MGSKISFHLIFHCKEKRKKLPLTILCQYNCYLPEFVLVLFVLRTKELKTLPGQRWPLICESRKGIVFSSTNFFSLSKRAVISLLLMFLSGN